MLIRGPLAERLAMASWYSAGGAGPRRQPPPGRDRPRHHRDTGSGTTSLPRQGIPDVVFPVPSYPARPPPQAKSVDLPPPSPAKDLRPEVPENGPVGRSAGTDSGTTPAQ